MALLGHADRAGGQTAIACGETIAEAIEPAGDVDAFYFHAEPDEVVSITVGLRNGIGAWQPAWELFDPDGASLLLCDEFYASHFSGEQCSSGPLPTSGIYTVSVLDHLNNNTGSYAITLEGVSETFDGAATGPPSPICGVPADGTRTLYCGATLAGDIGVEGDTDVFTFNAEEGDVFLVTVGSEGGFNPGWELFSPDGTSLVVCDELQCSTGPLPLAGTHMIKVFDFGHNGLGSYTASLELIGGAPSPCPEPDLALAGSVAFMSLVVVRMSDRRTNIAEREAAS